MKTVVATSDGVAAATAIGAPMATISPPFERGLVRSAQLHGQLLDNSSGNLTLTAARCLAGSAAGLLFAPGYRDGVAPYGGVTLSSTRATGRARHRRLGRR